MNEFVGNSISTWSALQIARRKGVATWYNSYSIPLADFFPVYPIPIAYTYTELSEGAGKLLLKTSILSARTRIPESQVHVLYHGNDDVDFRAWLNDQGVILHQHYPSAKLWTAIQEMFK